MANYGIYIAANTPDSLKAVVDAIAAVIKAGGTEAVAIAGLHALEVLAPAPKSMSISNCSINMDKPAKNPRS